jgi:hypothetical protein
MPSLSAHLRRAHAAVELDAQAEQRLGIARCPVCVVCYRTGSLSQHQCRPARRPVRPLTASLAAQLARNPARVSAVLLRPAPPNLDWPAPPNSSPPSAPAEAHGRRAVALKVELGPAANETQSRRDFTSLAEPADTEIFIQSARTAGPVAVADVNTVLPTFTLFFDKECAPSTPVTVLLHIGQHFQRLYASDLEPVLLSSLLPLHSQHAHTTFTPVASGRFLSGVMTSLRAGARRALRCLTLALALPPTPAPLHRPRALPPPRGMGTSRRASHPRRWPRTTGCGRRCPWAPRSSG